MTPNLPPDVFLARIGGTLSRINAAWWSRPFRARLRRWELEIYEQATHVRRMTRALDEHVEEAREEAFVQALNARAAGIRAVHALDALVAKFGERR